MKDGEWLEYSVDVAGGTYDVAFRVASPNDGGRLRASVDGTDLGAVDVPDTGGWQTYRTVRLRGVPMPDGRRVLRLTVETGEFNLEWVEFEGTSSAGSTPTPTPTGTPTQTPTETPTQTPTETPTQTPTETPTQTPTETPTQTPTETPTQTPTETPAPMDTDTPTPVPTETRTPTPTTTPEDDYGLQGYGQYGYGG
jgi:hypothetical protein